MSNETPPGGKIITNVRVVKRQNDGAGYLFNDSRAAHQGVDECDIICCPHCQCTINFQLWKKGRAQGDGGWCGKCNAPVCGPCSNRMVTCGCEPFMRKVDEALKNAARIRSNRKILNA